jgi:membrane associated rhomboid family serine protease
VIERLLTKLERRFGRYALGNITYGLVIVQAIGFALVLVRPDIAEKLTLSRDALLAGEWWRLVTFVMMPVSTSPIWIVFSLYWLFIMGRALEEQWGSFRFEIYWFIGIITTLAAVVAGGSTATVLPLITSMFLAFATLWPDYELRIFFILPVRVKWLALLAAAGIAADIGMRQGLDRLVPLAAVANYLLFFAPTLVSIIRRFTKEGLRGGARAKFRAGVKEGRVSSVTLRKCAICGVTNDDPNVDIRICSCEKCGGVDRELCLAHARNH